MRFVYTPGNAFQCRVYSHRHLWNGKVCESAESWSCGINANFREDYCSHGDTRCYVMRVFEEADPMLAIPDEQAGWILSVDPHALDDQIMLFSATPWSEPRGIKEPFVGPYQSVGAFRIREARRREYPFKTVWEIRPYPDGWTRYATLGLSSPRFRKMEGPYIVEIEQGSVKRLFEEVLEVADSPRFSDDDRRRFKHFNENLTPWFEQARVAAAKRLPRDLSGRPSTISSSAASATTSSGFHTLAKLGTYLKKDELADPAPRKTETGSVRLQPAAMPEVKPAAEKEKVQTAVHMPEVAPPGHIFSPLIEPAMMADIKRSYGNAVATAIQVGTMTKPLLVLTGNPGVGKSTLALSLIDDAPQRDDPTRRRRTLVVPVSSTWRGREDLLGYVNPVSSEFEPTEFTRFLVAAEKAWNSGDHATRLVVFEEFNLSQPEHWLSDILVLSEYRGVAERYVHLGGSKIRGLDDEKRNRVFLSPAVRFVATVNADHTTRTLSPRVLDRAAVIELWLEAKDAMTRIGLGELSEDQREAIAELDYHLRDKGASFSLRTALSLKACLGRLAELGMTAWDAIDLVLTQQVLVKVRLLARDPSDEALVEGLAKWGDRYASTLQRAAQTISEWQEQLASGRDVNAA